MKQKAIIVKTCPEASHGLDELNVQLNRGWQVRHVAPMGAAGVGSQDDGPALHFAALVILEREDVLAAEFLEADEEVAEGVEEQPAGQASLRLDDELGLEPGREN